MRSKLTCEIAIRREAAGLTQRALAIQAGCSASTIQAIELGRLKPSAGLLTRIKWVLDGGQPIDLSLEEWL